MKMKYNTNITNTSKMVTALLTALPLRQRDILYKRFGLKDGRRRTLEEIGTGYQITRERVRQIENDAKATVLQSNLMEDLAPFFDFLVSHFEQCGGICAEYKLFEEDAPLFFPNLSRKTLSKAYLNFLLSLHEDFAKHPESETFHTTWTIPNIQHNDIKEFLNSLVAELENTQSLVEKEQLLILLKKFTGDINRETLESYLRISKLIHINVFGEYGLQHWPEINTRGVRDKAYVILKKHAKPLHFLDIVKHINKIFSREEKDTKKAHPQTVHNELIKNEKFVLVGRGMYALSDWGYQPGRVSDVILRVLKKANNPLNKEAIVDAVLKERDVKLNTILLNLQNRKYFEKVGEKFTFKT